MKDFIDGAVMLGYVVSGLFFLRFWRITSDRLFAAFAVAFWMLALNRLVFALVNVADENRHYVYLIRLTAFVLIIAAFIDKNRTRPLKSTGASDSIQADRS